MTIIFMIKLLSNFITNSNKIVFDDDSSQLQPAISKIQNQSVSLTQSVAVDFFKFDLMFSEPLKPRFRH